MYVCVWGGDCECFDTEYTGVEIVIPYSKHYKNQIKSNQNLYFDK